MTLPPAVRKLLPWIAGWAGLHAGVAVIGRVRAHRTDEGDESTAGIRRTRTHTGFELRPQNPQLARVRIDLAMAGGELDLTALDPVPGGVDVTVGALMAGLAVRVRPDWKVWWEFSGIGGVGADPGVSVTADERGADLRLHVRTAFAGVGVEAG
ncbi:hypothetical protein [Blastococcus sp. SYSU D00820]